MTTAHQRAYYFEDFAIGQQIRTIGRTITESDIVQFAGLSGDWNQIHTDAEFCKSTPFGARVAHGPLVFSIATGLATLTGFIEGTIIAFESVAEWHFQRPVFIGDTIHADLRVMDKAELQLRTAVPAGRVQIDVTVKNQRNKSCQKGLWNLIIRKASFE
ncbi:MAG: MaoC family dehydratase N-terminal domain-containing protein [Leptospiraceae bacterium]|nr:MaoC family dehydratase N-terminal domain-containing protein [Leptospiraceae bacterium]